MKKLNEFHNIVVDSAALIRFANGWVSGWGGLDGRSE